MSGSSRRMPPDPWAHAKMPINWQKNGPNSQQITSTRPFPQNIRPSSFKPGNSSSSGSLDPRSPPVYQSPFSSESSSPPVIEIEDSDDDETIRFVSNDKVLKSTKQKPVEIKEKSEPEIEEVLFQPGDSDVEESHVEDAAPLYSSQQTELKSPNQPPKGSFQAVSDSPGTEKSLDLNISNNTFTPKAYVHKPNFVLSHGQSVHRYVVYGNEIIKFRSHNDSNNKPPQRPEPIQRPQPTPTGQLPKPPDLKEDSFQMSLNDRGRMNKLMTALRIPQLTAEMIVNWDLDELDKFRQEVILDETQWEIIRTIRRRGKNKMAARRARRRKIESIDVLADDLEALQARKNDLMQQYEQLNALRESAQQKVQQLEDFVNGSNETLIGQ